MERNPGLEPSEPLDPTAVAFGDGLTDPLAPGDDDERTLTVDKVIDDLQGPDPLDPQHTYLHE
jgi:hypothetical protein